ncbi:hypothetical protein CesoFtcFv8_020793 [Champsocephalus esox]|uniref:Uncharacterized protein n=1 Tax=Champsocephalus esox TaxID=159716 RepID=A0AAN8BCW6_9TELE|nr:hypothetical protein CesoFtcFv8_020793 [Champsocephalus esox]
MLQSRDALHGDPMQGGGDGDNGRCEAVGDRRDTSSHQRLSMLIVLCKQRGIFGASSVGVFCFRHPQCAHDCNWLRRHRKKKEIVHGQDIPSG